MYLTRPKDACFYFGVMNAVYSDSALLVYPGTCFLSAKSGCINAQFESKLLLVVAGLNFMCRYNYRAHSHLNFSVLYQ
jgi:hypothetical protein